MHHCRSIFFLVTIFVQGLPHSPIWGSVFLDTRSAVTDRYPTLYIEWSDIHGVSCRICRKRCWHRHLFHTRPLMKQVCVCGGMPQSLRRIEKWTFFFCIRFYFPGLEIMFDFRNIQRSGSSFMDSMKLFKLPSGLVSARACLSFLTQQPYLFDALHALINLLYCKSAWFTIDLCQHSYNSSVGLLKRKLRCWSRV